MSGKNISPVLNVMRPWMARAVSTDPLPVGLEQRLRELNAHLFPTKKRFAGIRLLGSWTAFEAAIAENPRACLPALRAFAGVVVPCRGLESYLPTVIGNLGEHLRVKNFCPVPFRSQYYDLPKSDRGEDPDSAWLPHYIPNQFAPTHAILLELGLEGGLGGTEIPVGQRDLARALLAARAATAAFMPLSNGSVLVCQRPVAIRRDARGRLGCDTAPALVWPDGTRSWYLADCQLSETLQGELNAHYDAGQVDRLRDTLEAAIETSPHLWDYFFEAKLGRGECEIVDTDGPWKVNGGAIMNVIRLCRVELEGHLRHYLCELPAGATATDKVDPIRILRVPPSIIKVTSAQAWTFENGVMPRDFRNL